MFCSNCGKQMTDGSRFCEHCGQPVEPVGPVTQETIIVPELPETEIPPASPMDQPTIIVPEIPDVPVPPVAPADPLKEIYPEKAPKKSKAGLIIGLVAAAVLLVAIIVVVILGVANDWWRAPVEEEDEPSTSSTTEEPGPNAELTPEEKRAQLKAYNVGGLNVYLSEDFVEQDADEDEVIFESEDAVINVYCDALRGADEDIDSSREFANFYEDVMEDEFEELERDDRYGIYYTVGTDEDGKVTICGFYVEDGYGWGIEAIADSYDETLIDYVTLALVDEDFVAPEPDVEVAVQEFGFHGLYLTVDSSFQMADQDGESVVYENDSMDIYVMMWALADIPTTVGSSQDFANWYYEQLPPEDRTDVRIETEDESFYYVLTADEDGWTTMTGLYICGGWGWMVTGETRDAEKDGESLIRYITSGRIVEEEMPRIDMGPQLVEFSNMQLQLDSSYKEVYRDNDYVFMSGAMEVYIFTGPVSTLDGTYASASELAQAEQQMYSAYWDNANLYDVDGVDCLLLWDDADGSASTAYGYYMVGDTWWLIQVNNSADLDEDAMLGIAGGGVLTVKEEQPFERGELASRDRISLTDQLTAEYYGLQVSYAPEWTVDTTWGPSGDYVGESMEMYTYRFSLANQGVTDAVSFAWALAEEWQGQWDSYEVGLAGGVPYVLLSDESSDYFLVIGTYANAENCWEIDVYCDDPALLEQAIWYATAGQILEGASMT